MKLNIFDIQPIFPLFKIRHFFGHTRKKINIEKIFLPSFGPFFLVVLVVFQRLSVVQKDNHALAQQTVFHSLMILDNETCFKILTWSGKNCLLCIFRVYFEIV